jgi:hypothetical protein
MEARFPQFRLALAAVALGVLLTGCNTGNFTDGLQPNASVVRRDPLSGGPQPVGEIGGQQQAGIDPANSPANAQALQAQQQPVQPLQPQQNQQSAALSPLPPVAFLPVTGAPQQAVNTLAGSMRSAARSTGVPVVVSLQNGAQYQVKGYFSALDEGQGTLVVYVWEVLDRNGSRVHRISGQERAGRASGDPWNAVGADVIDRVARSTMTGLRDWLQRRAG